MKVWGAWWIALAIVFCAAPAEAHRLNVFAYADNGVIRVESGFGRGRPAMDSDVAVTDAETGELWLSGRTDAKGAFAFALPEAALRSGHGARVRVNAGEGHQGEWLVPASEWAANPAPAPAPPASDAAPSAPDVPAAPTPAAGQISRAELEGIINAALDARLAPIKHMLAEQFQRGPSLRDVIGGLGWIVGLAGLAVWLRGRRRP